MPFFNAPALYPFLLFLTSYLMLIFLLAQSWHSSSTSSLIIGSVESSKTCIIIRSGGHVRAHTAPMESLYTSLSLYMGICTSTMGNSAAASTSPAGATAGMGSHLYLRSGRRRSSLTATRLARPM
uniref:Uncharacterized protein n=1 Tax=Arundo donax TaxID=35708 RepID=A0A0A9H0V5_ARUDO